MKRYIRSADQPTAEDRLNDAMNVLKDDFAFAMAGVEKISADGDTARAIELVNGLSEMINASIEEITETISE